jgi:ComF family protein
MGALNVKSTMINKLLQYVAPHYCYGCGKVGMLLCPECKYDISDNSFDMCLVCAGPSGVGICTIHKTSYERAWCVGERSGVLERLIDGLKFDRVGDAAAQLASLLDMRLPVLPDNAIIVPVPTVRSHIRQRGYDHTMLIAKRFAAFRSLECQTVLERVGSDVQRGRDKKQRFRQANGAFRCDHPVDPGAVYILVDDVVTTNATVRFAAEALRSAGATSVWVAALARQALDKTA